jgi:hypothetical protein
LARQPSRNGAHRGLTRDQILGADDLPRVEVEVPEWGGSAFVRTMTGTERDRFESEHIKNPHRDIRARLVAATLCDEQGNLLFGPADVEALGRKGAAALDRVFAVALRLNGIGKADVEELEKNSAASPSAASPSGSP